ncbi:DUF3667 domain-containing protein [Ancylomarina sp. YFZ004]
MKCKNCETIVGGKFCSHCGQDSKVSKITLPNFLNEVSESVFLINKGFFYTLINLFKRPGRSIEDFLNGKRKYHFKPIAYVLVFSTVYFLISRLSGENTWMNEIISGLAEASNDTESKTEISSMLTWLSANFAYATLILLPIFSFASYLSFWGLGKNYLEHIVLNSYVTGQQAIFYSIFLLPKVFIDDIYYLESIPFIVSILYAFWVFWQFFTEGNRTINIFRSILTYILYMVLSSGFLYILA